jgi:hypothetical protein
MWRPIDRLLSVPIFFDSIHTSLQKADGMRPGWPQVVIMASGAILILLGILAVCAQLYIGPVAETSSSPDRQPQADQKANASAGGTGATSRFAGVDLAAIGAVLLIVGYLGAAPWKDEEEKEDEEEHEEET